MTAALINPRNIDMPLNKATELRELWIYNEIFIFATQKVWVVRVIQQEETRYQSFSVTAFKLVQRISVKVIRVLENLLRMIERNRQLTKKFL